MLRFLVLTAWIAVFCALIAGTLGSLHPALDSFSHFRLHLSLLFLVISITALACKFTKLALSGVGAILVLLFLTRHHLPQVKSTENFSSGNSIKLLQLNLRFDNAEYKQVGDLVLKEAPDFVAFQEVTRKSGKVLRYLQEQYPYQVSCPFRFVGNVAIVSQHPFASKNPSGCGQPNGLSHARFNLDGNVITVASFHSYWPWPKGQSGQIDKLSNILNSLEGPLLIAGDFNAAPWSWATRRIAKLSNTQVAPGLQLTWSLPIMGHRWTTTLGLPLDNVLFSEEFAFQKRQTLANVNSDHFPVSNIFTLKNVPSQ